MHNKFGFTDNYTEELIIYTGWPPPSTNSGQMEINNPDIELNQRSQLAKLVALQWFKKKNN